jgi:hypothetical protein
MRAHCRCLSQLCMVLSTIGRINPRHSFAFRLAGVGVSLVDSGRGGGGAASGSSLTVLPHEKLYMRLSELRLQRDVSRAKIEKVAFTIDSLQVGLVKVGQEGRCGGQDHVGKGGIGIEQIWIER